jgi:hypothetical protein
MIFQCAQQKWLYVLQCQRLSNKIRQSKLEDCLNSERILILINKQFSRWQDTCIKTRNVPARHLKDHLADGEASPLTSVVRKESPANQFIQSPISPEYSRRAICC